MRGAEYHDFARSLRARYNWFVMRFLVMSSLFVALACGACSATGQVTRDGGPSDAAAGDAGTLVREIELENQGPIELRYLERATLRLTVVDLVTREPVPNVEVRFAILSGQSIDLGPDRLVTDSRGVVEKTITAGQDDADASIRIGTNGANGALVSVRVRAAGAASMNVLASYEGTRAMNSWVVDLFESSTCVESAELEIGTKSQRISGASLPSFRFVGLGADAAYAVRVRGFGSASTSTPIVTGCEQTPALSAATVAELVVPLHDAPLFVSDAVEMRLSISAPTAPLVVTSTLSQAVSASAGTENPSELAWLLDGMRASLETQGGDLEAWDTLRRSDAFTSSVAGALASSEQGPRAALSTFVNALAPLGEGILLDGTLDEVDGALRFAPTRLSVSRLPEGFPEGAFDALLSSLSVDVAARFDTSSLAFAFERFDLGLGLGSLSEIFLRGALDDTLEDAVSGVFYRVGGCDTLAVAATRESAEVCDGECLRTACEASYAMAATRVVEALAGLDVLCPSLRLQGSIEASDSDSNGSVDTLSTSTFGLSGQWGTSVPPLVSVDASVSGAEPVR